MRILSRKRHAPDSATEEQVTTRSPQLNRKAESENVPAAARLDSSAPQNIINLQRLIGNRATINHIARQTTAEEQQAVPGFIQSFGAREISLSKPATISRKPTKIKGRVVVNLDTMKSYTDDIIKFHNEIIALKASLTPPPVAPAPRLTKAQKKRNEKIKEKIADLEIKGVVRVEKYYEISRAVRESGNKPIDAGLRGLFGIKASAGYMQQGQAAIDYFRERQTDAKEGKIGAERLRTRLADTKYGTTISPTVD